MKIRPTRFFGPDTAEKRSGNNLAMWLTMAWLKSLTSSQPGLRVSGTTT
jgi:hypothetical protein